MNRWGFLALPAGLRTTDRRRTGSLVQKTGPSGPTTACSDAGVEVRHWSVSSLHPSAPRKGSRKASKVLKAWCGTEIGIRTQAVLRSGGRSQRLQGQQDITSTSRMVSQTAVSFASDPSPPIPYVHSYCSWSGHGQTSLMGNKGPGNLDEPSYPWNCTPNLEK